MCLPSLRPSRFILLLGVFGYLFFAGDAPAQKAAPPTYVRLGSWNIEHLGNPGARRGPGEGVLQQPQDLARYIRYARLDLLAVQEIAADGEAPEGFPKKYRTNSTRRSAN